MNAPSCWFISSLGSVYRWAELSSKTGNYQLSLHVLQLLQDPAVGGVELLGSPLGIINAFTAAQQDGDDHPAA